MQFLKIVLFLTFTLSLSYKAAPDDKFGQRQINDGTYRIERTASPEDCAALCQADTDHICRGHVFYQPDVSLPDGECRLNSGIGEHSLFKIDAPDAINIKQVLMST